MQRTFVRQLAIAVLVIALVSTSVLSIAFIARANQNSPYVLTRQTVPLVSRARLLGAASEQQRLDLSIGLQLRNRQELEGLLSDMYNPQYSLYHHFLSPQQFATEFGPTAAQPQQVIDYLHQQGLSITHISSNRLLIDASATVAQAEVAFQVSIKNYQLGATVFYANANAPTIPGSLSSIIASIGGLDNSVHMHPLYHLASPGHGKPKPGLGNSPHTAQAQPHAGPGGGYTPADLNGAYDANPLLQAGIQGSGQTVAVFELDGYPSSDVTQYFQTYNLGNPSITNVLVDGFNGSAGAGAIEVDLDIEVSMTRSIKSSPTTRPRSPRSVGVYARRRLGMLNCKRSIIFSARVPLRGLPCMLPRGMLVPMTAAIPAWRSTRPLVIPISPAWVVPTCSCRMGPMAAKRYGVTLATHNAVPKALVEVVASAATSSNRTGRLAPGCKTSTAMEIARCQMSQPMPIPQAAIRCTAPLRPQDARQVAGSRWVGPVRQPPCGQAALR